MGVATGSTPRVRSGAAARSLGGALVRHARQVFARWSFPAQGDVRLGWPLVLIQSDPAVRWGLQRQFDWAGYTVASSATLSGGLSLARSLGAATVIVDCAHSPQRLGRLARALRRGRAGSLIVGDGWADHAETVRQLGFDAFLYRPWSAADALRELELAK